MSQIIIISGRITQTYGEFLPDPNAAGFQNEINPPGTDYSLTWQIPEARKELISAADVHYTDEGFFTGNCTY